MASSQMGKIEPKDILLMLTSLPHRGAGTEQIDKAASLLKDTLKSMGASVESQFFLCPKTYLPLVWWIVGGVLFGLIFAGSWPWLAFAVAALFALSGLAHFDWRPTPLPFLVPRVRAENIIARKVSKKGDTAGAAKKIILMAHYDSAPVSFIYRSSMVAGFRRSLLISIGLMLLAPVLILLEAIGVSWVGMKWLRYGLVLYFLIQIILSSVDYFRYGFTNGAADNASGVAVAITAAQRMWLEPGTDWDVELVLTSGEEVAMIGALEYFRKNADSWRQSGVYLLNFDNLGSGKIKFIFETGSITRLRYINPLFLTASRVARDDTRFADICQANWHTGDFDSIWFERAGIPSLTLSSQDENGLVPHLHRPGDTIEKVDLKLLPRAVDFTMALLAALRSGKSSTAPEPHETLVA